MGIEQVVSGTLASDDDRLLGFTIPRRDARGRAVRLGPALNEILRAHDYPRPLARLLAEALALTAMLGSMLRPKDPALGDAQRPGQVTMQAMAEGGPVTMMVTDWRDGELRGYLQQAEGAELVDTHDLQALFGKGYLAITLEQTATEERYQGIVPLQGESLAEAASGYFEGSEQLPTLVRLTAGPSPEGGWAAGGLMVQYLPRGEVGGERLGVSGDKPKLPPDWEHVSTLAATITEDELLDETLPLENILWRLFNEDEVRVTPAIMLSRGCRCSVEHIRQVLESFPESERVDMRGADGLIGVDCQFCSRLFKVDL